MNSFKSEHFYDLSLKARGVLHHMIFSNTNEFYFGELVQEFPDGRTAARSAIDELIQHGIVAFFPGAPARKAKYRLLRNDEWYERKPPMSSTPEGLREYNRKYNAEHKEQKRAANSRRRARKRNAEGSHTADDIKFLLSLQNNTCLACKKAFGAGASLTFTIDHIIPLSRGGGNGLENIQILCNKCNSRKNAKTMDYRSKAYMRMIQYRMQRGLFTN